MLGLARKKKEKLTSGCRQGLFAHEQFPPFHTNTLSLLLDVGSSSMKVSVLGAGAIGSMLGGLLKHCEPDIDVLLVMRGEHGQVVEQRGTVELTGPWGRRNVQVNVSFDVADIAGSDFVFCTVKSQATEEAIRTAAPYLDNAIVISIQNGINDDTLLRHVSAERLVMGMTATNMAIIEPGSVSMQLGGTTVVGPSADDANTEAAKRAADLLRKTGLQIDEHPNVLGVRYNKLAINALGYASCLSASNFITEAFCHGGWRKSIGLPIINECISAFSQAGITLAKIPGRPAVSGMRRFMRLLDKPIVGSFVAAGAKRLYNRKPIVFSLYQDLLRGKPTEVDYVNGEIVRLAESNGGSAPYNAEVVEITHELEQKGPASFLDREVAIQRFRQLSERNVQQV